MTNSYEDAREDIFTTLASFGAETEEYINAMRALELLNKAEASLSDHGEGIKGWFEKHSDALIRVGGTFGSIALIGFVESKFDVIFRSKASKYL